MDTGSITIAVLLVPPVLTVLLFVWPVASLVVAGLVAIYGGFALAVLGTTGGALGFGGPIIGFSMISTGLSMLAFAAVVSAIIKAIKGGGPIDFSGR